MKKQPPHSALEPGAAIIYAQLVTRFGNRPIVKLSEICDEYLGISITTAKRKAWARQLKFGTAKLGSNKAVWLVDLRSFAIYFFEKSQK
jgi:hypothetical protein